MIVKRLAVLLFTMLSVVWLQTGLAHCKGKHQPPHEHCDTTPPPTGGDVSWTITLGSSGAIADDGQGNYIDGQQKVVAEQTGAWVNFSTATRNLKPNKIQRHMYLDLGEEICAAPRVAGLCPLGVTTFQSGIVDVGGARIGRGAQELLNNMPINTSSSVQMNVLGSDGAGPGGGFDRLILLSFGDDEITPNILNCGGTNPYGAVASVLRESANEWVVTFPGQPCAILVDIENGTTGDSTPLSSMGIIGLEIRLTTDDIPAP